MASSIETTTTPKRRIIPISIKRIFGYNSDLDIRKAFPLPGDSESTAAPKKSPKTTKSLTPLEVVERMYLSKRSPWDDPAACLALSQASAWSLKSLKFWKKNGKTAHMHEAAGGFIEAAAGDSNDVMYAPVHPVDAMDSLTRCFLKGEEKYMDVVSHPPEGFDPIYPRPAAHQTVHYDDENCVVII